MDRDERRIGTVRFFGLDNETEDECLNDIQVRVDDGRLETYRVDDDEAEIILVSD